MTGKQTTNLGPTPHGPDKLAAQSCRGHDEQRAAELRKAIDEYRAEEGLEPVDWEESDED